MTGWQWRHPIYGSCRRHLVGQERCSTTGRRISLTKPVRRCVHVELLQSAEYCQKFSDPCTLHLFLCLRWLTLQHGDMVFCWRQCTPCIQFKFRQVIWLRQNAKSIVLEKTKGFSPDLSLVWAFWIILNINFPKGLESGGLFSVYYHG